MVDIDIHYRPFKFLPWQKVIKTRYPIHWNELTETQIISIILFHSGKFDDNKLLRILLNVDLSIVKKINRQQKDAILRDLKCIQNSEHVKNFTIKEIAGFNAPGENLEGVTYGAFMFGDMYHQNYMYGLRDDLNRFIACFYTDDRGLDEKLIFENTQKVREKRFSIRLAIAINYEFIHEELEKTYPDLFKTVKELQRINKSRSGFIDILDFFDYYNVLQKGKFTKKTAIRAFRYLDSIVKECHGDPNNIGLTIKAYSNRNYN